MHIDIDGLILLHGPLPFFQLLKTEDGRVSLGFSKTIYKPTNESKTGQVPSKYPKSFSFQAPDSLFGDEAGARKLGKHTGGVQTFAASPGGTRAQRGARADEPRHGTLQSCEAGFALDPVLTHSK